MIYNKEQIKNSSMCAQPWFGTVIETDGSGAICCEIMQKLEDVNIRTHSLIEFQNHDKVIMIRNLMRDGIKPKDCKNCFEKEEQGLESLRHVLNELYFHYNKEFDTTKLYLQNIEIRIGNLCQLQCVMCNPIRSAKINTFFKSLTTKTEDIHFLERIKPISQPQSMFNWVENEVTWNNIASQCGEVRRIYLNGGEPLLAKYHLNVLNKLIELNIAKDIELNYSTNGILINEEHIELWNKFNKVNVTISIDDIDERNRFIRYPSIWQVLLEKLDTVSSYMQHNRNSNVVFQIWCTINILNFAYMKEYIDFFKTNYPLLSIDFRGVQDPAHLNPANIPQSVKQDILNDLLQHNIKSDLLSEEMKFIVETKPNNEEFIAGLMYIKEYASYHRLDLNKTFPKLSGFFKNE